MKKLFSLILILALLPVIALADTDLSGYSYAELTDLYKQVQRELMSRPEWKEVTVPQGSWRVGEDIPAGSYTISLSKQSGSSSVILWGAEHYDYDTAGGLLVNAILYKDDNVLGKITLKDGNLLEISGTVIFTPVKGLGF